jgi:ATP-dependent Clp protease ATP-binding subunit ClpA
MFERFTNRARLAMAMANQEAQRLGHEYIGTEHILLGLVREGSGIGGSVIKSFDVDLRAVRLEVEKLIKNGPDIPQGKLPQTPRAKKVIEYAILEMRSLKHRYVGTEHILLGLLKEGQGVAFIVLSILGLSYDQALTRMFELLAEGRDDSSDVEADPRNAGLRLLLSRGVPGNIQPDDAGVFDIRPFGSGAVVTHRIFTQVFLASDDLGNDAEVQAVSVMRSTADRLEKAAVALRESAGRLKHE